MLRFKKQGPNSLPTGVSSVLTQSRDWRSHALATTKAVTIGLDRDEATDSFVTVVEELHGMSTFGDSELEALEMTAEMIRGYIESMEERGMPIPLGQTELAELKGVVGL